MRNILRRAERGSVLFIILIAVALFAALGYAVSNMMQSGSSGLSISEEKASIEAGEILDYGRKIRQAVQAMRINGCSDTEISFENPIVAGYENGTDTDCQVFDSDGDGMYWVSPADGVNDGSEWVFTGSNIVDDAGTALTDLTIILRNVNDSICTQINTISGISALGSDSGIDFTQFTGSYATVDTVNFANGQTFGCLNHNNGGTDEPFFYQVLITR